MQSDDESPIEVTHIPNSLSKSRIKRYLFLLVIIIIVAAGIVAYVEYEKRFTTRSFDDKPLKEMIEQQRVRLSEMDEQIKELSSQVKEVPKQPSEQLSIRETYFLVLMAQQQLKTTQQLALAIHQLEAARLSLNYVSSPLRERLSGQIDQDIDQLKRVPVLDKTGLWHRLDNLKETVSQLSFKKIESKQFSTPDNKSNPKWQKELKSTWIELKGLIRVTSLQENAIVPAFNETERQQIKLLMQADITQAQMALLNGEAQIYKLALGRLQNKIIQHIQNQNSKPVLSELEGLMEQPLTQDLPSLEKLLSLFEQPS